jgi:hypothetical protein
MLEGQNQVKDPKERAKTEKMQEKAWKNPPKIPKQ